MAKRLAALHWLSRGGKWICLGLALAPLLFAGIVIVRLHVDVPFYDEWELVFLLRDYYQGDLSVIDLWSQHNEHRVLLPRLILLYIAHATAWNTAYELAANMLLAAATLGVLSYQTMVAGPPKADARACWQVPLISLIVFSLSQWENWFWGWQIAVFLNILAVVTGVVVLAARELTWRHFVPAVVLGIVATYSFACGLNYWPLGLVLVVLAPRKKARVRRVQIIVWITVAAAILASYLYDYHPPEHVAASDRLLFIERPLSLLQYTLVYLGNPVSADHPLAAGLVGLIVLLLATLCLLRLEPARARAVRPYLCLSVYAVMSAAMTGIGRLSFGVDQAASPRYITMANLLWICNVLVLSMLAQVSPLHRYALARRPVTALAGVAIALIACAVVGRSAGVLPRVVAERDRRLAARAALLSEQHEDVLKILYPDPKLLRARAQIAKEYHLSIYRHSEPRRARPTPASSP